jgi:hypothetical protein
LHVDFLEPGGLVRGVFPSRSVLGFAAVGVLEHAEPLDHSATSTLPVFSSVETRDRLGSG